MCIHSSVNEPKSVVSHCATVLCKFPCATIHSTIHWIVDASFLDSLDTPKKQPPCLLCRGGECVWLVGWLVEDSGNHGFVASSSSFIA